MNSNDDKNLEQFIHTTLRSLPARRAPRTLEHRVLAAIEARQALPWWHQSFSHWPMGVKLGFLGLCAAVIGVVATVHPWASAPVSSVVNEQMQALAPTRSVAEALGNSLLTSFRSIPSLYLYGAIGIVLSLYAALFGIGAAAYRSIFANR